MREVHQAYATSGARVITTNSYALVPFHIGEARFAASREALAALAGQLARDVADEQGSRQGGWFLAAALWLLSCGPLSGRAGERAGDTAYPCPVTPCGSLAGGDHEPHRRAPWPSGPAARDGKPFWVSFTLEDEAPAASPPCAPASGWRMP